MLNPKALDEFAARFAEMLASSPAKDVEKNARALFSGLAARLDLVTRQEFEVQQQVLARTREKLAALEARVATLETRPEPSRKNS
jgi:BMFP domain-containing protein YqiC